MFYPPAGGVLDVENIEVVQCVEDALILSFRPKRMRSGEISEFKKILPKSTTKIVFFVLIFSLQEALCVL